MAFYPESKCLYGKYCPSYGYILPRSSVIPLWRDGMKSVSSSYKRDNKLAKKLLKSSEHVYCLVSRSIPSWVSYKQPQVRAFWRHAKNSDVFTVKPPCWKLLSSIAACLENIPAVIKNGLHHTVIPYGFCKIVYFQFSESCKIICNSFSNEVPGFKFIGCYFAENDVFYKSIKN